MPVLLHSSCSGQLQLRFVWEVTARSLLTIKLHALERVLAQRQEILAALQPVPAAVVRSWAPADGDAMQAEAAEHTAQGGIMGAGVSLFGLDSELGLSGTCAAGQGGTACLMRAAEHAAAWQQRSSVQFALRQLAEPCLFLSPFAPRQQVPAGPASLPRWPQRCWPATRTTTTGATWR